MNAGTETTLCMICVFGVVSGFIAVWLWQDVHERQKKAHLIQLGDQLLTGIDRITMHPVLRTIRLDKDGENVKTIFGGEDANAIWEALIRDKSWQPNHVWADGMMWLCYLRVEKGQGQ